MRRTTMLWEVFVTRFQEAFGQYEKRRLSSEEAGEPLGMSGRNFRRLCVRSSRRWQRPARSFLRTTTSVSLILSRLYRRQRAAR